MNDFTLNEFYEPSDIDENHEKTRERKEHMIKDKKARAKRRLIRDKHARRHEAGFGGNV